MNDKKQFYLAYENRDYMIFFCKSCKSRRVPKGDEWMPAGDYLKKRVCSNCADIMDVCNNNIIVKEFEGASPYKI